MGLGRLYQNIWHLIWNLIFLSFRKEGPHKLTVEWALLSQFLSCFSDQPCTRCTLDAVLQYSLGAHYVLIYLRLACAMEKHMILEWHYIHLVEFNHQQEPGRDFFWIPCAHFCFAYKNACSLDCQTNFAGFIYEIVDIQKMKYSCWTTIRHVMALTAIWNW